MKKTPSPKSIETLKHDEARRKNIPTAEFQSVLERAAQNPVRVACERRNRDLDPHRVWRGRCRAQFRHQISELKRPRGAAIMKALF